jgi:hypothetical protein
VNPQQLRIVRESVRHNSNPTEVANALYTPRFGVSEHFWALKTN